MAFGPGAVAPTNDTPINALPKPPPAPAQAPDRHVDAAPSDDNFDRDAYAREMEKKYGLPEGSYVALLDKGEHSGPTATSPKGAYGDAQLMPDTAREMGVKDIRDRRQNIEGGAKYLAQQYKTFGDITKAQVAYNEGPAGHGVANNPETRAYIARIQGRDAKAANASQSADPASPQKSSDEKEAFDYVKTAHKAYEASLVEQENAGKLYEKRIADFEEEQKKAEADRRAALENHQKVMGSMKPIPENKQVQTQPMQVLGQFLPMLAMLGGARARSSAIGALQAAAAAMNGRKKNDEDAFKQAHETWLEQMQQRREAVQEETEAYKDILENEKLSTEERIEELHTASLIYGNKQMNAAAKEGALDKAVNIVNMYLTADKYADDVYWKAQEAGFRKRGLDIQESGQQLASDRISPANKAYNAAYKEAISHGKTEEEASQLANDALKRTEEAIHPTALAAMNRADARLVQNDPEYKKWVNIETPVNNLRTIDPVAASKPGGEFTTGPGQLRVLDSFTKAITGGQAIREFMVNVPTKYANILNKAAQLMESYKGGKAPFMDPALAAEYYKEGLKVADEAENTFDKAMAAQAQKIDNRGGDPAAAIGGEVLGRVISKNLYTPSARVLAEDREEMGAVKRDDAANRNQGAVPTPTEKDLKTLHDHHSPEDIADFDSHYHPGAAEAIIQAYGWN